MPFIVVVSGSNGCVLVVSWDVKNSRPDLMEGDKAVKHQCAAMPLNKTQMQGRMDCSGKEREKKEKGIEKIDDLHPRARGKLHPNFSVAVCKRKHRTKV